MANEKFNNGDLLVPNDDLAAAFHYDVNNTELLEHVEYRLATSAEMIYFKKYMKMQPVNGGLEAYKKTQQTEVNAVYASIDKEKTSNKKQGLS